MQLLSALDYIHNKKDVFHRDLKVFLFILYFHNILIQP
jgi:serine/threonine protein kinase